MGSGCKRDAMGGECGATTACVCNFDRARQRARVWRQSAKTHLVTLQKLFGEGVADVLDDLQCALARSLIKWVAEVGAHGLRSCVFTRFA